MKDHGKPPTCENPGCPNPVKWAGICWRTYCSPKCNRLANRALRRDAIMKEEWFESDVSSEIQGRI